MMSTAAILLFHLIAVVFLIFSKTSSTFYGNKPILSMLTRVDLFLVLFITLNSILGIYSITAGLSALLFIIVGKAISLSIKNFFIAAYILLGLYTFALATHFVPGFYRPLIVQELISDSVNPFLLYLSTDKALAGILLLTYAVQTVELPKIKWVLFSILGALSIFVLSLFLGVPLEIKYGYYLLWFIPVNLFVTCLAEEIFFRKIIQKGIGSVLPNTLLGIFLTVLMTSYFFIVAHGILFIDSEVSLLYFCAGFFYALIYQMTRSILLSVLSHFLVNVLHIVLLEYPLNIA